jgi:hypothetical protein
MEEYFARVPFLICVSGRYESSKIKSYRRGGLFR